MRCVRQSGMLNSLDPDRCAIGSACVWTENVMQVCGDAAGRRLWSMMMYVQSIDLWEIEKMFVPPKYLFFHGYIVVT